MCFSCDQFLILRKSRFVHFNRIYPTDNVKYHLFLFTICLRNEIKRHQHMATVWAIKKKVAPNHVLVLDRTHVYFFIINILHLFIFLQFQKKCFSFQPGHSIRFTLRNSWWAHRRTNNPVNSLKITNAFYSFTSRLSEILQVLDSLQVLLVFGPSMSRLWWHL